MSRKKKSNLEKTPDEIREELGLKEPIEVAPVRVTEDETGETPLKEFELMSWRQNDYIDAKGKPAGMGKLSVGPKLAASITRFLREVKDYAIASYRYLPSGNISVVSYPSYQKREIFVER